MKKTALAFVILALCVSGINAQTIKEVISKYHQSMGGVDKLKSHTSTRAVGKAPTPQGDFPFEMLQEKPNKTKIMLEIMGKKMVAQAYDGKTAWMLNPFMGETAQKLPDEQAKAIVQEAEMEDPFIDMASKGSEAVLEGSEDIEGTPCFKVKLIKFKGIEGKESTQFYYFDKETGIPVMIKTLVKTGDQPEQEVETYLSDYQEVEGGVIMPFKIETKMAGQVVNSILFEKVVINQDIPDEEFAFPGEAK